MAVKRANKRLARLIPLLQALQSVKPEYRVVFLAHLDDESRDQIYQTIDHVLRSDSVPFRKRLFLKSKLGEHRQDLRYLASILHTHLDAARSQV